MSMPRSVQIFPHNTMFLLKLGRAWGYSLWRKWRRKLLSTFGFSAHRYEVYSRKVLSYGVYTNFQIIVPSIWQQWIQTFVSSGLGKVSHIVGVAFNAEPPFPWKYPTFIFYPLQSFFFTVTPTPILRTFFGYAGIAYHWKLFISLDKQRGPLYSLKIVHS